MEQQPKSQPQQQQLKTQAWDLIEHITAQVDQLMARDLNTQQQLAPLAEKLRRLVELHRNCTASEYEMRLKMLGLMRERNLYLEKCRALEKYGESCGWEGANEAENDMLANVHEILYQQQDDEEEEEEEEEDDHERDEDPDINAHEMDQESFQKLQQKQQQQIYSYQK